MARTMASYLVQEGVLIVVVGAAVYSTEFLPVIPQQLLWVLRVVPVIVILIIIYFSMAYGSMVKRNALSVDGFIHKQPRLKDRVYVTLMHWMAAGLGASASKPPEVVPIPLEATPSPYVADLRVNSDAPSAAALSAKGGGVKGLAPRLAIRASRGGTVVVGTIRMGFGHHRIAHSACSWALGAGMGTYFHDLLNVKSREADIIRRADRIYSKGSRLASEWGGVVEQIWGSMTLSGGANSLRTTWQLAEELKPLMMGLDKDIPVITSHSLVGMTAVACGFKHVINLVIDNWAQWFVTVPGAINLVQGASNYENLLRMGMPPSQLRLAGHWVPKELRDGIDPDCRARMVRAKDGRSPRRLLVPVGGAGAQRKFVSGFVESLKEHLLDGSVRVFLNAGDHSHMHRSLLKTLEEMGIKHQVVRTYAELTALVEKLLKGQVAAGRARVSPSSLSKLGEGAVTVAIAEEKTKDEEAVDDVLAAEDGLPAVTMFAFDDYFAAVAATDILIRVSDVLCCKPSELAFYPVPKLMIRRVGDHEAHSATRASELGDGTREARTLEEASRYVDLLCSKSAPDLFLSMNNCIMANASAGIYDGCKVAVDLAAELVRLG